MDLDMFIKQVVRRWYIIVALLVAAVAGTVVYHRITGDTKATSVLAVLQPKVAAPGEYIPPGITLEAVDESSELAERVAARLDDGTTVEELRGKISLDIRVSTKPSFTPLYTASFKDTDEARALLVNAIVVEEAILLYGELNQPDAKDVRTAFKAEVDRAEAETEVARGALSAFEQENEAANLPARRDQLRGYSQQLQLIQLQLSSGQATSAQFAGGPLLAAARAELDRLTSLENDYTRLKWDSDVTSNDVLRLQGRVTDLEVAAPAGEGVSPFLDQARVELDAATARQQQARDTLSEFQRQNGVSNVTASRESQLALVNQLGLAATSQSTGSSAVSNESIRVRSELDRLEQLAPRYNDLALDLQRAEVQLSTLEQRVLDIISGQTLPSQAQVRVLGQPEIEANLFWLIITYGLAVLLAIFGAFTIIYLLAVFEPMRPTPDTLEGYFDLPVLAHVPHASRREE